MQGGTLRHSTTTEAQWLAMHGPLRLRTGARVDPDGKRARPGCLQHAGDGDVSVLVVEATGAIAAEHARDFAAVLLDVADLRAARGTQ